MIYSEESTKQISNEYLEVKEKTNELILKCLAASQGYKCNKAANYMREGVCRRLRTVQRCSENVFTDFPLDQAEKLTSEVLTDVAINIQAFVINVSGLFDNLAWVYALERGLYIANEQSILTKLEVGLYNKKMMKYLPEEFREYLTSQLQQWFKTYSKAFRDSLAHRIPLYVPPSVLSSEEGKRYQKIEIEKTKLGSIDVFNYKKHDELMNEQQSLGAPSFFFAHSGNDTGQPAMIHAQLICDFKTIEELIENFLKINMGK